MGLRSQPIALVGLMGAGKTAVARTLAARLGAEWLDLDAAIAEEAKTRISRIFATEGEAAFRVREERALVRAIESGVRVIACGGGAVLSPSSRIALASRCATVWLEVTPAEAARRLADHVAERPLLAGGALRERLERLLEERAGRYDEAARWRIPTDGRTPMDVAEEILERLERLPS